MPRRTGPHDPKITPWRCRKNFSRKRFEVPENKFGRVEGGERIQGSFVQAFHGSTKASLSRGARLKISLRDGPSFKSPLESAAHDSELRARRILRSIRIVEGLHEASLDSFPSFDSTEFIFGDFKRFRLKFFRHRHGVIFRIMRPCSPRHPCEENMDAPQPKLNSLKGRKLL